ncbi:nucleotidyltransferase domain-containing protein [Acinetobacter sp. 161(2023)]|uniref:nucleotidyltransferase domain-containing protein n=1 Tax=Acinetobacter sp. 161(2023) TaxID=3098768 RepID=UPI00300AE3A8
MSLQSKFNTFNQRIQLTRQDEAYKEARQKDESITDVIKTKFKENGYSVIENFVQGSLATFTGIKEKDKDFDIDRAIVINHDDAPDDPVIVKRVILDILEDRGFHNTKIKKPCVTADYKFKDLHIDIPVYRKTPWGSYQLAVGKKDSNAENKVWSDSAPLALIDWVNDSSIFGEYEVQKLYQFRRLVRYLKRWRNLKFSHDVSRKIYSIGLTIMIKQHFKPSIDSEGCPNDLIALKNTLNSILNWSGYFISYPDDQWKIQVSLPVSPYRDIFHGSSLNTGTRFRNRLSNLNSSLQTVIDESDESKQCSLLIGQFGDDFPEGTNNASATRKAVFATSGAVGTSQGA